MKIYIVRSGNTFKFVAANAPQTTYNLTGSTHYLFCEGQEEIVTKIYINLLLFNINNGHILNNLKQSLQPGDLSGKAIIRFRKLCRENNAGCLIYEGPSKFRWSHNGRKETTPHRFAYLMSGKSPLDILQVHSSCKNPNCIKHLSYGIRKRRST